MKKAAFLGRHILSVLSSLWFLSNLLIWLTALILLSPFKLMPNKGFQTHCIDPLAARIYRAAVLINSFWMKRVVGIRLEISGALNHHTNPIILCNHQSWFDIPLIQEIITARGPIVRFLVKRELIWVPIIGWICLVLNFPRLRRSGSEGDRAQDYKAITRAVQSSATSPGALLIFAEGTRFTQSKQVDQASPFPNLLRPKVGGFRILLDHAPPDQPVLDVSIAYVSGDSYFWHCLHGGAPLIKLKVDTYRAGDITDVEPWLAARWSEKSRWLTSQVRPAP
ncbi:MAG: 1-acyl-sn-glycerol-3-phosphate acyltransferase [Pseudomonadales bacterium]